MRVLVAIAHHGTKNRAFLERMMDEFRSMDHDVHVVILSEAPKDLGEDVEVLVGMPSKDPWSLPFAHRPLFAERLEQYDLFVYSEDDTLITARHLDTFVELSERLPEHYLPGFMRFEEFEDGTRSYSTIHSFYRWLPDSIFQHDDLTFASFSNEHAACFALTRSQLRLAIASGGFLIEPHKGRYDMLVSAATDPYTRCGFTKVLCLERMNDLLVHHMPNVYLGRLGASPAVLDAQLDGVRRVASGERDTAQLLEPEVRTAPPIWSKNCYGAVSDDLIRMAGGTGHRLLSVGASTGDVEVALARSGAKVEAIPVDQIFRSVVASRRIEVWEPHLTAPQDGSGKEAFDIATMIDVLQFTRDPVHALEQLRGHLHTGGRIIVGTPDHRRVAWLDRLRPHRHSRPLPSSWEEHGVHRTDPAIVRGWLTAAGFSHVRIRHRRGSSRDPVGRGGLAGFGIGTRLLITARA